MHQKEANAKARIVTKEEVSQTEVESQQNETDELEEVIIMKINFQIIHGSRSILRLCLINCLFHVFTLCRTTA